MQGTGGGVERAGVDAHVAAPPGGDGGELGEADVVADAKADARKVWR